MNATYRIPCLAAAVLALAVPALATVRTFDFDSDAYYGTTGAPPNCSTEPTFRPPLFNHPAAGSQTAAKIVATPAGCDGSNLITGRSGDPASNGNASFPSNEFSVSTPNSNELRFSWADPSDTQSWVRITTTEGARVPYFPNPTVDIRPGSSIKMKFLLWSEDSAGTPTSGQIDVALIIRETGRNLPLGANGGASGTLEFVGVDSSLADAPYTPSGGISLSVVENWVEVEWRFVDDNGVTKVDVIVDGGTPVRKDIAKFITGNDVLTADHFRGTLDSLAVVRGAADSASKKWFINVDDVTIEAPGITDPVQVLGPVLNSATSVTVGSISPDASEVKLYKNATEIASQTFTPGEAPAQYTFTVSGLEPGDILTATQVVDSLESPASDPVTVQSAAAWTENFDSYADQAAFNTAWPIANTPTTGPMTLATTTVQSCPNSVLEPATATNSGTPARRYHNLGLGSTGLNGSDTTPLWFTFYMYHGSNTGQRNYVELRRYNTGSFGGTLEKIVAFGAYNNGVRYPSGGAFDGTRYQIRDVTGTGALDWRTLEGAGSVRVNNAWVKMQIKITASNYEFFVNGTSAGSIPRVGTANGFTTVVVGSGLTNNNTAAYFDSFSFSLGESATDPFGTAPPSQVAVQGPIPAGATTVTVTGVNTAPGTQVIVYNTQPNPDVQLGAITPANGSSTVNVTVPALSAGQVIQAVQRLADQTQSCLGPAITVGDCSPVPAVLVHDGPLSPTSTNVRVTQTANGRLVKVYKVVAGVPTLLGSATAGGANVDVPIAAGSLAKGDIVAASQTINTVEGCIPTAAGTTTGVAGSGTNKGILLTLGLREASNAIEWVFPAGSVAPANGGAPQGKLITPSLEWQTVTFDLTGTDGSVVHESNISGVADNGVLDGASGFLEHLAITQNGADTGPYVLYIDNIKSGDTVIEDFESYSGTTTQAVFRQPSFSGTTYNVNGTLHILSSPNSSYVSGEYADGSTKSDKIQWQFKDEGTNRWIRLTTSTTPNNPAPAVSFTQPITMRFLLLPAPPECPSPFADVDEDDDIDMDDFGAFQACYDSTGVGAGCACWDRVMDGKIDLLDFNEFKKCVTGPSVPFNPLSPPVGCNP